jgi:hypothetical protein
MADGRQDTQKERDRDGRLRAAPTPRDARLKAALKANIARRKARAQALEEPSGDLANSPGGDPSPDPQKD